MPDRPSPIPITRPVFGARERELLLKPLETGWGGARTLRTRGIVAVSLFGLAADLPRLSEIADRHTGAGCAARLYSLHPRKAITTGEGGMITTSDAALAELVGKLRNHGAEATDLERHQQQGGSLLPAFNLLGFNYRLTDLQGALGVAQMERVEDILAGRRTGAAAYDELLAAVACVSAPWVLAGYGHAYQSYVALYRGAAGDAPNLEALEELNRQRNRLMTAMEKDGITVRQGTHAVHTLGYYAHKYGLQPQDLPRSLLADRLSITLPLYAGIEPQDQARVVAYLRHLERYF